MNTPAMSHIAYRRVSTTDQNLDRQLSDTGITFDRTFEDMVSGADTNRPELQLMLSYAREGDTIHVHSIDRFARNLGDLNKLITDLNAKGITVQFHKEALSFTGEDSPMSNLMLNLLGSVYQFERAMLKERQREGINKAKLRGVYKGRPKTIDVSAITSSLSSGVSIRKTATSLDVSVSTVQRVKKSM